MSTKKTIQINPELFKLPGNRTRKNRDKKELILNPIVSPNNLKNKLLKRIKEHKTKELKTKSPPTTSSTDNKYTDEFYGALDYLSELSKKQKIIDSKRLSLNTRTLKNHESSSSPVVSLELPAELQETKTFAPQTSEVFNVNYKVQDDVPYGCLKNGKKKTYREWKELSTPDIPDIVRPPTPPKKNVGILSSNLQEYSSDVGQEKNTDIQNKLSREERLEQIKNKLKRLQDQETQMKQQSIDEFKKLEKQYSSPLMVSPLEELSDLDTQDKKNNNIEDLLKEHEDKKENENEKIKKYLKKTVKRKFTLGKSDKLRRVSVLIKDRKTRKNIINTQKELKKTTITDVKKYLRQHGIIKVGSTCPADILRKTFESAVLTGEVINTNKEVLLHNFLSGEKEE
jgi:rubrerythrin